MAASPANAREGRRRTIHIDSSSADAASAIMRTDGIATRRSARRKAPSLRGLSPRTVPVIPWRANVVRSPGTLASHGEMYPVVPEQLRRQASTPIRSKARR